MRNLTFKPNHLYRDILKYVEGYNHLGPRKFLGTWDENLYYNFVDSVIIPKNVSEEEWPYRNLEDDFYFFNSYGYRTHEFDIINKGPYDLAIGCSVPEGIGVRLKERWDHYYQEHFNRNVVNISKGGGSPEYVSLNIFGWFMQNRPKPERILIVWPEPSRQTKVIDCINNEGTALHLLPTNTPTNLWDEAVNVYQENFLRSAVVQETWSNSFVQYYNQVNLFLQALNIKVYNFILDDMWPKYDFEIFRTHLIVEPFILNFQQGHCDWYHIHAGVDGIHPSWRGHQTAANRIITVITNEEN